MDNDRETTTRERNSSDPGDEFHLAIPYRDDRQLTITEINRLQQGQGSVPVVHGDADTLRPGTA